MALHAKEEALCQTAVENGPLQTAGGKGANLIKIPRARPLTRFQSTRLNIGESWSGYCNPSRDGSPKYNALVSFDLMMLQTTSCVHGVNENDRNMFLRNEKINKHTNKLSIEKKSLFLFQVNVTN